MKYMTREISEEEYQKFLELLENQKKELSSQNLSREIYIKRLIEHYEEVKKQVGSYGTVEIYALVFAKFLDNMMKVNKIDVYYNTWTEMQRYLTDTCLEIGKEGKRLKRSFKKHLRNRGFVTKINRKYNTFTIKRRILNVEKV
jgi:hypothetical protein